MENNDWKECLQHIGVSEKIRKVYDELRELLRGVPDSELDNTRSAITMVEKELEGVFLDGKDKELLEYVRDLDKSIKDVMDLMESKQMVNRMLNLYSKCLIPIAEGMSKDILEHGKVNPEFLEKFREFEELCELSINIHEAKNIEEEQRQLVYEAKNIEEKQRQLVNEAAEIEDRQEELDKKKALLGKDYNNNI